MREPTMTMNEQNHTRDLPWGVRLLLQLAGLRLENAALKQKIAELEARLKALGTPDGPV